LVGAACLISLGARSLQRAWALWRERSDADAALAPHSRKPRKAMLLGEGAVTNLLNPSIPVFYVGSVPQFIGPDDPFAMAFFMLGAIHVTMALACHTAYAVAFGRAALLLSSRGRAWILHATTGAALVALAALSLARL